MCAHDLQVSRLVEQAREIHHLDGLIHWGTDRPQHEDERITDGQVPAQVPVVMLSPTTPFRYREKCLRDLLRLAFKHCGEDVQRLGLDARTQEILEVLVEDLSSPDESPV